MANQTASSLPIIERKWLNVKLFSGKEVKYRPLTVGQQKMLLLVKETQKSDIDTYKAVVKMVSECVDGVNVEDLHPSEFEYLFYNIRATSDSKLLKLSSNCSNPTGNKVKNDKGEEVDEQCGQENEMTFNVLDDFTVTNKKNFTGKVEIKEENMIVNFRQPRMKDVMKLENKEYPSEEVKALDLLNYCIVSVVHNDQVYDEFSYEDANKFINSLPDTYLKPILEFFKDQPAYVLKEPKTVKCEKCGKEYKYDNGDLKGFL